MGSGSPLFSFQFSKDKRCALCPYVCFVCFSCFLVWFLAFCLFGCLLGCVPLFLLGCLFAPLSPQEKRRHRSGLGSMSGVEEPAAVPVLRLRGGGLSPFNGLAPLPIVPLHDIKGRTSMESNIPPTQTTQPPFQLACLGNPRGFAWFHVRPFLVVRSTSCPRKKAGYWSRGCAVQRLGLNQIAFPSLCTCQRWLSRNQTANPPCWV